MRQRVRACFQKSGDLRFLGHRDLVRTLERLFRRLGCSLSMSEGFHPKAKFSFPLALATGIVGEKEVMEVELGRRSSKPTCLLEQLMAQSPAGTDVHFGRVDRARNRQAAAGQRWSIGSGVPADRASATQAKIDDLLSQPSYEIRRPGRKQPIDVRADLETLEIENHTLRFVQRITRQAGFQPRELLEILGLSLT